MAMKCEFCGKAPAYGNVVSHANNTRRRRWNPNLKRMRAVVAGGKRPGRVCTACIRAGRVKRATRASNHEHTVVDRRLEGRPTDRAKRNQLGVAFLPIASLARAILA